MSKTNEEETVGAFLFAYTILGSFFLAFMVCLVLDINLHFEYKINGYWAIAILIIIPVILSKIIFKLNGVDSDKEFYENYKLQYEKRDLKHPIYYYLLRTLDFYVSVGLGIVVANLLLLMKY